MPTCKSFVFVRDILRDIPGELAPQAELRRDYSRGNGGPDRHSQARHRHPALIGETPCRVSVNFECQPPSR
jgi:hypothetical protein